MSGKRSKRLRRAVRKEKKFIENKLINKMADCGLITRLKIAWMIVRGKKQ